MSIDVASPGASKENIEPEQPFSGGRRRMSPGWSPLGRRHKKRMEGMGTEGMDLGMGDESAKPAGAKRRHAQRSLRFEAASEPAVSLSFFLNLTI